MVTSTEDKLVHVRVSIGAQVRAVRIRRSIFKIRVLSTRMGRWRTVVTAVILLKMVVVGSKQPPHH